MKQKHLCWIAIGMLALPVAGRGQILVPPNILRQHAEREERKARAQHSTTQPAHAVQSGDAAPSGDASPSRDASPQTRPANDALAARIAKLRVAAMGADPFAAMSAVRELRSIGQPARSALSEVVRQLLAHDRATLQNSRTLASAADLRKLSDQIADERKAARANINKLAHDETLKIARQHFDSLKQAWEKLHGEFVQADAVAIALSRRGELLGMYRALDLKDARFSDDAETKLAARAQRAFGFTAEQAAALPELGKGPASDEPVLRDLWFFRACRRIEAYNRSVQSCMSAGELANLQCVNAYREYLGVLPYEIDSRLVSAARGHSQEMVDLKYFAHESPVAANKTPWDRIRNAGYPRGTGENIAYGPTDAEQVFWMWFNSPPHHQNMASISQTAIGIGQVGNHWTQDMGSAPRAMLGR